MTDNDRRELRELLIEWAEGPGVEFELTPKIVELLGMPDLVIVRLRNDAAYRRKQAHWATNGEPSVDAGKWYDAEADVLEAEANLMEAKTRLRDLQFGTSESQEAPDVEAA